MKIRKNVTIFKDGHLQVVDLNEKGEVVKNGKAEKPVEKKQEEKPARPPTKRELMATLKEMGVTFNATMSSKGLQELIDAHSKSSDDASGDEDSRKEKEDSGGTGNQDVI